MPEPLLTTAYLVLRKTPVGESGLVLAGLTPEHGQLHFLVKGARKLGRRQFPVADLFRVLQVEYRDGERDLLTWRHAETREDLGAVAQNLDAFRAAGRLARFALANTHAGVAMPRFFRAMTAALRRLGAEGAAAIPAATSGVFLLFLEEQGWLPPAEEAAPERAARREALLAMGEGLGPPPVLEPEAWQRTHDWAVRQLKRYDCDVP